MTAAAEDYEPFHYDAQLMSRFGYFRTEYYTYDEQRGLWNPFRPGEGFRRSRPGYPIAMDLILWILAVVLVVAGVLALFRRQILWGIVLIVVGLLVGPGGVSLFS